MKVALAALWFALGLPGQTASTSPGDTGAYDASTIPTDGINVDEYGAADDGTTDNTAILNHLFLLVSDHNPGATLRFPCAKAGRYLVKGELTFRSHLNYVGSGGHYGHCIIVSEAAGVAAAFNFVGADYVDVRALGLTSANSVTPPKTAVTFGRTKADDPAGHMDFFRVNIEGYATQALVYSVGSEEQRWWDPVWVLNGGGAKYVLYTSDSDELNICSCPQASNTDNRFYGIHFMDYSSTHPAEHSVVYIGGEGTMDWLFDSGYISTPGDGSDTAYGSAFTFHPSGTNALAGNITVQNVRVENAVYFAQFGGAQVNSVHLLNNTLATTARGVRNFAYGPLGTTVNQSVLSGNLIVPQTLTIGSSFASLTNSFINEYFPVTLTAGRGNVINHSGTLSLSGAMPIISAGISAGRASKVSLARDSTTNRGQISFKTGHTTAANGALVSVVFVEKPAAPLFCTISPGNALAARLATDRRPFVSSNPSATGLTLTANSAALVPDSGPYLYGYVCF